MSTSDAEPKQPPAGEDSTVEDWMGQSVERDAELADQLVEQHGEDKAAEIFDEKAAGEDEQEARHGEHIDPEQGEKAYKSE